jgi:trans-aconitate methyltransferase
MSQTSDRWNAGSTYEQYMGRWSRGLAREFVRWLQVPSGVRWLEVGCGTGALTAAILEDADPASILACDPAKSFVEFARDQLRDGRVSFVIAGAADFPVDRQGYDVVTSSLALNFFPDPPAALDRMCSAATPRGAISACVWDYAGGMEFLRYFWDAVLKLHPSASNLDEAARFPICSEANLTDLFSHAGLTDVRCESIDTETVFSSFDDYWQPFLGGTGPAPSFVASLRVDDRDRLRSELNAALPADSIGTIALKARAWAVRGRCSPRTAR